MNYYIIEEEKERNRRNAIGTKYSNCDFNKNHKEHMGRIFKPYFFFRSQTNKQIPKHSIKVKKER